MTGPELDRRSIVVVGAGGHGREVIEAVQAAGTRATPGSCELFGVVADDADLELLDALDVAYLGPVDDIGDRVESGVGYVIGIGSSTVRRSLAGVLDAAGLVATTVVHPDASIGRAVHVGSGCYLATGARLTTNVRLGHHVHVNVNAVVSHDTVVEDFVTLSPGVLVNGTCHLGEGAFLGTGAVVLPGLTVGSDAVVAAGAVVTNDVAPGATVVGVPARPVTG